MVKVLITGGREFSDKEFLYQCLSEFHEEHSISLLIHGCAKGADTLANEWSEENSINIAKYPVTRADWGKYGKAAGVFRNQDMLNDSKPDFVLAFDGANGTKHMKKYAQKNGYAVITFSKEEKKLDI